VILGSPADNSGAGVVQVFDNSSIPLPITISSFDATSSKGNIVLAWKTVSEVNNFGFEVQRSSVEPVLWIVVGFVKGNGTSIVEHSYEFVDNSTSGSCQYRLKQIDLDGTFHFSPSIQIATTGVDERRPIGFALEQNYPNPFNPVTRIAYVVPQSANSSILGGGSLIRLSIFDMIGRELATLLDGWQPAGRHEVTFDAAKFSSGTYVYRLTSGGFSATRRMILLK
jgi:hypothetical protein